MTEEEKIRFWAKVDQNGPVVRLELGNCWIWTKSTRNGYGAFAINRKAQQAHRLSYEQEYGQAPGLLRHKCDNRICVRPSHLEPGTHKQNTQDMLERNKSRSVLTNEVVVQARLRAAQGESIHKIVAEFGDRPALLNAIQGNTFGHITDPPPVSLKEIYRPIYNKLSEEEYDEIFEALKKPYHGQGRKLAEKYGVHPSLITLIKKQKLKTIRGAS